MKIVIIGPIGSGKSKLRLSLAGQPHELTSPLYYGVEQSKFNLGDENVTLVEAVIPPEMFRSYVKDSDALIYCVDLSHAPQSDKQAIEEIDEFQRINPNAKLILVGTHIDQAKNPQEKLKKINALFGNRFTQAVGVSLAPKQALKADFVDNLRQEIVKPLLKAEEHQTDATESHYVVIRKIKYPEPPKPFPKSYTQLWNKGAGQEQSVKQAQSVKDERRDFLAALEVLRDYSKSNNPDTCSFFGSKVKLAVTRHLFRHHTDVVDELYKEYYKKDKATAGDLISALKEKLILQGDTLNFKGSLAQRIRFIEQQANLEPTKFFELNEQIQQGKISISSPK